LRISFHRWCLRDPSLGSDLSWGWGLYHDLDTAGTAPYNVSSNTALHDLLSRFDFPKSGVLCRNDPIGHDLFRSHDYLRLLRSCERSLNPRHFAVFEGALGPLPSDSQLF
jgi:hypothetical protein